MNMLQFAPSVHNISILLIGFQISKILHLALCVHNIKKSISPLVFKFVYMVTMDRISDASTFGHRG